MFFFSSRELPRAPSNGELLALTDYIKGHHKATAKYTEAKLRCVLSRHQHTCMKLTSQGTIDQRWGRMRCSHQQSDGSIGTHTFNTVELWYQVPSFPEELHNTLHWVSVTYPPPEGSVVVCRPCPDIYIDKETDYIRDDEPHPDAPSSPSGMSYYELGAAIAQQCDYGASRQNESDQSDEGEWIDVGQQQVETLKNIKKRLADSPARMGTPNPFNTLTHSGHEEKRGKSYVSPNTSAALLNSKEIVARTGYSPKTPSPLGGKTLQNPQRGGEQAHMAKLTYEEMLGSKALKGLESSKHFDADMKKKLPNAQQKGVDYFSRIAEAKPVAKKAESAVHQQQVQELKAQGTLSTAQIAQKDQVSLASTEATTVGVPKKPVRSVTSEMTARAILRGEDPFKPKRTPLTDLYVEGIKRNKKGSIRKMLLFYKIEVRHIADMHWKDANTIVLTVPRSKEGVVVEQVKKVPGTNIIEAFDPLDITAMKTNPRYTGLSDVEMLIEACKLAKERIDRAVESLPPNRKGTIAYHEYRKATLEWEKKRREEAIQRGQTRTAALSA